MIPTPRARIPPARRPSRGLAAIRGAALTAITQIAITLTAITLTGIALIAITSRPAAATTPAEVEALVARAAEHVQTVGRQRAMADFSRPDGGFVNGEAYVFCDAADGTVLANGGNPKLVGKSLITLQDTEGRAPIAEMIQLGLTQGHGWVEYPWPNLRTGQIQPKSIYVVRVDEQTVCASGYYKTDPP